MAGANENEGHGNEADGITGEATGGHEGVLRSEAAMLVDEGDGMATKKKKEKGKVEKMES